MRYQSLAELDDADWTRLDAAVGQLEESWRTASDATLGQLVPPCGDPLRGRVLIQLVKIDQEYRWRAGRRKLLEAYLADWPELAAESDIMTELLEAECRTRAMLDVLPAPEELRARFPEIAGGIDLAAIAAEVEREGGRSAPERAAADTPGDPFDSTPPSGTGAPRLTDSRRPARYQVRGILGQGGMGTVYRAYDTQLEREVALKVPSIDPTDEPAVLERFLREAKTMARIRHPNICQVFDAGQSHGTYYMAMALIEGQSLAAWVKDRVVDSRQAAELLYKLAHALAIVHAAGVLHRDLKPQNVMIDQSGEPLLMDFGLARPVQADSPLTGTHSVLGTPAYMSPEQVNGEPASRQSDIYSLGVIFYQVLTGRLPFTGPLALLAASIVKGDPPKPRKVRAEVDPELEAICLKAMARRPADRYQTAAEMVEVLQAYLRASPRKTPPPSRIRRRAWLAAAAAAPLLLVAGVIVYLKTDKGTLVLEVNPPDVTVTIDGNQVRIKSPRDEIRLAVGEHDLEVGKDGFHAQARSFTIERGGKAEIVARLEAASTQERPSSVASAGKGPPGREPKQTLPDASRAADGKTIMLKFDSPVPATIKDKNGFGTGFTHWLPGTGGAYPLDQPNPNFDLLVQSGSLQVRSTRSNLEVSGGGSHLNPFAVTPAVYIPGVSGKDLTISVLIKDIHVTLESDQFVLFAAASVGKQLRGGCHVWSSGANPRQYYLSSNRGGWDGKEWYGPTGAFVEGDKVRLTLTRTGGSWGLAWNDYSQGTQGGSPRFSFPWLDAEPNLYCGIWYANPTNDNPKTSRIESFSVSVGPPGPEGPGERRGQEPQATVPPRLPPVAPPPEALPPPWIPPPGRRPRTPRVVPPPEAPPPVAGVTGAAGPGRILLTLHSPQPVPDDRFGFAVAGVGKNILVGSYHDHRGGKAGAAYLFDGTTGKLLQVFDNPTPAPGDEFGESVAAVGSNVLIAAKYDNTAAPESGAAYLFNSETGQLLHTFVSPTPIGRDWLGYVRTAVAGLGDDVLAGVSQHYSGAGVVFRFDGRTGKLKQTFQNPAPHQGDSFGLSVAALENNVIVGAPWATGGAPQSGAVYLFDGTTGKLLRSFAKPKPAHQDEFGYCVAAVGKNVLVGCARDQTGGAPNSGAAYLFEGSTGRLLHTLLAPSGAARGQFAVCVAALSDDILVGTYGGRAVCLFDGKSGKLLQTFEDPRKNPGSLFGCAVASLGRNVIVGAFYDDTCGFHTGTVYLFAGPEKHEAQ